MSSDDIPTSKNPGKGKKGSGAEISEQLLKSLKPSVGAGTTNWLADLTQSALEEESQEAAPEPETRSPSSTAARNVLDMVPLVDKLFDLFTNYIYEFNRSMGASNLTVNCERPIPTKEGDSRYGLRGGPAFQGRLSMHSWSLIVRGESDRVNFVILPSDQLFAFNADPDSDTYVRCCVLESVDQYGQPGWNIAGSPLESDHLSVLAKQLLGRLVKVVKGEIDPLEEFDWTGSARGSGHKSDTGAPIDQSGQFNRTVRGLELGSSAVPRPKSFDEDADPVFAAVSHQDFPAADARPSTPAADTPPRTTPSAPKTSSGAAAPATVDDAFSHMEKAVDAQLEELAKAGARAFESQDLEGAEQSLKKTTKVKEFRDKLQAMKAQWQSLMSEK